MGLRLFHITEYAQSVFLSPESQREATPPWMVVLVSGLWLALAGNWAFWQALFKRPEFSATTPWGLLLVLAVILVCVIGLLLCTLNWHYTLKPGITLLLFLSAINTHQLLTQGGYLDGSLIQQLVQEPQETLRSLGSWRLIFTLSLIGVAPALWLWRTPVRRVTLMPNGVQNMVLILLFGTVLFGAWLVERHALSTLAQSQPPLTEYINPFNSLWQLVQALKGR